MYNAIDSIIVQPLVVLRCCFDEFKLYFLGAIVMGVVICRFFRFSSKRNCQMVLITMVGYIIFEGLATGVYAGHMPGIWAVILGIACLGTCAGCLFHLIFVWGACRILRKKR